MLESLRFKRAARALLRAEVESKNELPISLSDVESLWIKRGSQVDLDCIVKASCAIIYNSINESNNSALHFLIDQSLSVEAGDALKQLNSRGLTALFQQL